VDGEIKFGAHERRRNQCERNHEFGKKDKAPSRSCSRNHLSRDGRS
jgi:hypothetical protein